MPKACGTSAKRIPFLPHSLRTPDCAFRKTFPAAGTITTSSNATSTAHFNFLHEHRAGVGEPPFDTIRCPFFEGRPVFTGSKIAARTHIQWCIRDPRKSVVGYFRVRG